MKSKIFFLLFVLSASTFFMVQCAGNSIVEQNTELGQYLSRESIGCLSKNKLSKVQDVNAIDWNYSGDVLQLNLFFTTQCAAETKDSVILSNDAINIFVKDTSRAGALCVCPFKEMLYFRIPGNQTLKINFSFKQHGKMEYSLLADTTIFIPDGSLSFSKNSLD